MYFYVPIHLHYTLWKYQPAAHIIRKADSLRGTNVPGKGNSDDSTGQAIPLKDNDDNLPVLKMVPCRALGSLLLSFLALNLVGCLSLHPGGDALSSVWGSHPTQLYRVAQKMLPL